MEIRQAISMYLTAKAYNDQEFKTKFEDPTRYHKRIVKLVNENMGEIKRRNTKQRIAV